MRIEKGKTKDRILTLGWDEYTTGDLVEELGIGSTTASVALRELYQDGFMRRTKLEGGNRYAYYPTGKEYSYYEPESGYVAKRETNQSKEVKLNTKWLTTPMIGGRV